MGGWRDRGVLQQVETSSRCWKKKYRKREVEGIGSAPIPKIGLRVIWRFHDTYAEAHRFEPASRTSRPQNPGSFGGFRSACETRGHLSRKALPIAASSAREWCLWKAGISGFTRLDLAFASAAADFMVLLNHMPLRSIEASRINSPLL